MYGYIYIIFDKEQKRLCNVATDPVLPWHICAVAAPRGCTVWQCALAN